MMKRKNKILSILMLIVLLFISVPVETAVALGVNYSQIGWVFRGNYVVLEIYIESQDGVAAYQSSVAYDNEQVSYVKYEVGAQFKDALIDVNEESQGNLNIAWTSSSNVVASYGNFLSLYFEIKDYTSDYVWMDYNETVLASLYGNQYGNSSGTYGMYIGDISMNTVMYMYDWEYTGGERFPIYVAVNNNKGFSAYQATITYDANKVCYESYTLNIQDENVLIDVYDDKAGTLTVAIVAEQDIVQDGVLYYLNFKTLYEVEGSADFEYSVNQMNNLMLEQYPSDNWSMGINITYKDTINVFSITAPESVGQDEEFEVYVNLEGNTGFGALDMAVEYDSEYLEIVSVEKDAVLNNALISTKNEEGKIIVGAISGSNITESGKLLKLVFRSKDKEVSGTELRLDISSFVSDTLEEQEFTTENATLAVAPQYFLGDANEDGKINIKDSALVRRYVAGWNVIINMNASDVNGDGKINIKDSALIRRYVAGWNVEFVK